MEEEIKLPELTEFQAAETLEFLAAQIATPLVFGVNTPHLFEEAARLLRHSAEQVRQAVLAERECADAFRWLMANTQCRIALATEVFGYEKMDVPAREWLEDQIAAAIRGGK